MSSLISKCHRNMLKALRCHEWVFKSEKDSWIQRFKGMKKTAANGKNSSWEDTGTSQDFLLMSKEGWLLASQAGWLADWVGGEEVGAGGPPIPSPPCCDQASLRERWPLSYMPL